MSMTTNMYLHFYLISGTLFFLFSYFSFYVYTILVFILAIIQLYAFKEIVYHCLFALSNIQWNIILLKPVFFPSCMTCSWQGFYDLRIIITSHTRKQKMWWAYRSYKFIVLSRHRIGKEKAFNHWHFYIILIITRNLLL